jgi:pyruvate/2-oxoglutarate dehydrogenase complex dihydrolipoamide acyltransferase (E2) component
MIVAPVDGVITKVISNIGQNLSIGSPVAEFSGKQPQILTDVDPEIATNLQIGDTVPVIIDELTLS